MSYTPLFALLWRISRVVLFTVAALLTLEIVALLTWVHILDWTLIIFLFAAIINILVLNSRRIARGPNIARPSS